MPKRRKQSTRSSGAGQADERWAYAAFGIQTPCRGSSNSWQCPVDERIALDFRIAWMNQSRSAAGGERKRTIHHLRGSAASMQLNHKVVTLTEELNPYNREGLASE